MTRTAPLVIINPAAGGGSAGRDWTCAVAGVGSQLGAFECAFTETPGDARRIAEEEARAGRRLVIAFGGDGTISEVAEGLLRSGSRAELGVVPHGTGADFARSLALPRRPADAARALREGRSVSVDVGKVVYAAPDGRQQSRHFINSASFGLSGAVTDDTNRSSKSFGGFLSFASSTLKTALSYDPPDIYLEIDERPAQRLPITNVALNNGRYFGGGMKMAPEASLVDGYLDLVVVAKMSFLKILREGPRLYAGAHLGLPEVHHLLVTSVRARAVHPKVRIALEVDGESPGCLPAAFEVLPRALRLRVPRTACAGG